MMRQVLSFESACHWCQQHGVWHAGPTLSPKVAFMAVNCLAHCVRYDHRRALQARFRFRLPNQLATLVYYSREQASKAVLADHMPVPLNNCMSYFTCRWCRTHGSWLWRRGCHGQASGSWWKSASSTCPSCCGVCPRTFTPAKLHVCDSVCKIVPLAKHALAARALVACGPMQLIAGTEKVRLWCAAISILRYVPRTGLLEEIAELLGESMPKVNAANLANISRRCGETAACLLLCQSYCRPAIRCTMTGWLRYAPIPSADHLPDVTGQVQWVFGPSYGV
jgi:hypothetical protein